MTATPQDPAWWKSTPEDRWQRLRGQLRKRRTDLAPRYHNRTLFTQERGLNAKLAYDVEKGPRRNFDADTLAAVAAAYAVTYDSVLETLRGGELQPIAETSARRPASAGEQLLAPQPLISAGSLLDAPDGDEEALGPFIQSVHADLGAAMRDHGPGFSGSDAFEFDRSGEFDAIEARAWDDRGLLPEPDDRVRFIAIQRFHRVEAGFPVARHPELRAVRADRSRERGAGLHRA